MPQVSGPYFNSPVARKSFPRAPPIVIVHELVTVIVISGKRRLAKLTHRSVEEALLFLFRVKISSFLELLFESFGDYPHCARPPWPLRGCSSSLWENYLRVAMVGSYVNSDPGHALNAKVKSTIGILLFALNPPPILPLQNIAFGHLTAQKIRQSKISSSATPGKNNPLRY